MKKYLMLVMLATGITSYAVSQDALTKAKTQAAAAGFDVKSIASGIMGKLGPSLALSAIQKPKVLDAVTGFLNQKSGILNLMTSDKAQYVAKLAGLNTDFMGKMKGILTATQYTQLLGLKPKTVDASNPLSQLFF
jgi:hypothetical protein